MCDPRFASDLKLHEQRAKSARISRVRALDSPLLSYLGPSSPLASSTSATHDQFPHVTCGGISNKSPAHLHQRFLSLVHTSNFYTYESVEYWVLQEQS